jgi:hypothetical protein
MLQIIQQRVTRKTPSRVREGRDYAAVDEAVVLGRYLCFWEVQLHLAMLYSAEMAVQVD